MAFKKLFLGEYLLVLLSVYSSSNFEVTSVESSYGRGLSGTFLSILEVCVCNCAQHYYSLQGHIGFGVITGFKAFVPKKKNLGRDSNSRLFLSVKMHKEIISLLFFHETNPNLSKCGLELKSFEDGVFFKKSQNEIIGRNYHLKIVVVAHLTVCGIILSYERILSRIIYLDLKKRCKS